MMTASTRFARERNVPALPYIPCTATPTSPASERSWPTAAGPGSCSRWATRALPASVLADEAGVAASTASAHLSRLVKGRMLRVKRHGRHRYFRLAGPEVGHLAGSLGAAIAARMIELGWVRRAQRSRAVHVSHNGYEGLRDQFGIELSAR
jgi:DNA-binding transcriptional ArsR family regulator